MIPARKGGALTWALERYVARKVRSAFRGMWLRGELPARPGPRLVYLNHSSWWDGFMLHQLSRTLDWDCYALMEEENLRRYPFLARLGAFSIRRHDPHSALQSLRYAKGLLARPRAAVFVFPEGEQRVFGTGPLRLERGVELLARTAQAECVPIAVRYAFLEHERPDILLEVGRAHGPAPLGVFADALQAGVERLARVQDTAGFTRVLAGGRGVAERWDRVRGRASPGTGSAP